MTLKGKVCIATGAANGIGPGIARRYAADGAMVAVADLSKAFGVDAMGVGMDVSEEAAVNSGVARVGETLGRIDVLVSKAGIQIVHPLEESPFAGWKTLLAIHPDGAFLTSRACLPHMKAAGGGSVMSLGRARPS